MRLEAYGRSTGFAVDPIEKKPLYHFLPGSRVLSFGTAGCNLGCRYCQNWHMSKSRETDRMAERAGPRDIAEAAERLGCASVAFTYNDPVVFLEYAVDTARECRARGLGTVAVTAGYILPEARGEFFESMDAVNVDLKSFSDDFYRRLCSGRLEPVLDTLRYLRRRTRVWMEITTLLIPGENDSEEEIGVLSRWIVDELGADTPLHFTAFHPAWRMADTPRTPLSTLSRAREQALSAGLRFVYTGNLHDPRGSHTSCPKCGTLLIERSGYSVRRLDVLGAGQCPHCRASIPGLFDPEA